MRLRIILMLIGIWEVNSVRNRNPIPPRSVRGDPAPVLTFLIENGNQLAAFKIKTVRLTIVYPLNGTLANIIMGFVKMQAAYEKWRGLTAFQDEAFKSEFYEALQSSNEDLLESQANIKRLYSFAGESQDVIPQSNCQYIVSLLTEEQVKSDSGHIEKLIDKISTSWVVSDFRTDFGKLSLLYNFINAYSYAGSFWFELTKDAIAQYDELRGGTFPSSLLGHLEEASCLQDTKHKKSRS